jgi:hypothetical protein
MAIRIAEVKSSGLSEDKNEVIVGGFGKYVGDVELRFGRECVGQLIDALTRAQTMLDPALNSAPGPAITVAPVSKRGNAEGRTEQIRFEVPKNFTVMADSSGQRLVLLILNHRLENQEGYALAPDAAKQVAGGLIKSADALLALKPPATSTN